MAHKPRASYAWEDREKWLQLPFPVEEYQARIDKLRVEMGKEGFDALLVHGMPARSGHVRYVANFNSFLGNTIVVLPKDGDPAIITETVFHGEPMPAIAFVLRIISSSRGLLIAVTRRYNSAAELKRA